MFPQPSPQPDAARLFDKHTIDTPEQLQLDFAVAGIGSRFLAILIDSLIETLVVIVFIVALAIVMPIVGRAGGLRDIGPVWLAAGFLAFFFLIYFGYYAIFEIVWNGQTPGKRIIGIRVVKDSGRPLTATETIGRNLLRLVDQLPGFYAIGILVAVLNSRNKRLGDLVAGSLVVREASFTTIKPVWQTQQPEQPSEPRPMLGGSALSIDDLALIDAFLNRRNELPPEVRSRMAIQILTQLRPKLPPAMQPATSPEAMLEALAWERRAAGRS
jgi:uncharacterized RDD family membrane protein YckC